MDENNAASVPVDPVDLLAIEDPAPEMEQLSETFTAEVIDDRFFMTTPIDDYTVTEGLLLCILIVLIVQWLIRILKGGFWWL